MIFSPKHEGTVAIFCKVGIKTELTADAGPQGADGEFGADEDDEDDDEEEEEEGDDEEDDDEEEEQQKEEEESIRVDVNARCSFLFPSSCPLVLDGVMSTFVFWVPDGWLTSSSPVFSAVLLPSFTCRKVLTCRGKRRDA